MAKESYNYGLKDLNGNPVPDSRLSPVFCDMVNSTGDYAVDCKNGVGAYCVNGTRMRLSSMGHTRVKFVAGLWRVIDVRHKYNVIDVRDKKFILGDKIDHREKNLFEYYQAALFADNCYGVMQPIYNYVVAKYDTDNGPIWSYGMTIEQARAFLGIALFDKHVDMIHGAERAKLTGKSK